MPTLTKTVMGFIFSIPSMPTHGHMFNEEICLEGIASWMIGPVKALVIRVIPVCLPTQLHYPPHQFQPGAARTPAFGHPPGLSK